MVGVINLEDAADNSNVGGKADSLGKLIQGGFNVPRGFVITELDKTAVLAIFDHLAAKRVAVRSSAIAEDGTKDAWAGQLDTFLNVRRAKLINKVKACFQSAKSDRARAYARQKNIEAGKVAVIIQEMVPSEVSGVAFSLHPVTNDRSKMVIEAVKGLGEKLVSGAVTPDTYVIDKRTRSATEEYLQSEPTITASQIKELAQTVVKIEELFGFPVDVEWAYSNGQLYILQGRPITTVG